MQRVFRFSRIFIVYVLAAVIALGFPIRQVSALPISAGYGPMPANGDFVITAYSVPSKGLVSAIELTKISTSSEPLPVVGSSIDFTYASASEELVCRLNLNGSMLGKSLTFLRQDAATPSQKNPELLALSDGCQSTSLSLEKIEVFDASQNLVERVTKTVSDSKITSITGDWQRKSTSTTYRKGIFSTDFEMRNREYATGGLYISPNIKGLKLMEIMVRPIDCPSGQFDKDMRCSDYLKFYNSSEQTIDLSQLVFVLSTTKVKLRGAINPGQVLVISKDASGTNLALPASSGLIWMEDRLGLEKYDLSVPSMIDADKAVNKGKVWAYDNSDDSWKWAKPSPLTVYADFSPDAATDTTNDASILTTSSALAKPCNSDQFRNPETGRCKKIASADDDRVPCKENQYRSEETGRCRSLTAETKTQKPCADDQFRNPDTGRCKKIASSEDPAPCDEGKERNPQTHRCRNIKKTMPEADFAPQKVTETNKGMAGWWAFGGAITAVAGYGAWEWRREADRGWAAVIKRWPRLRRLQSITKLAPEIKKKLAKGYNRKR